MESKKQKNKLTGNKRFVVVGSVGGGARRIKWVKKVKRYKCPVIKQMSPGGVP